MSERSTQEHEEALFVSLKLEGLIECRRLYISFFLEINTHIPCIHSLVHIFVRLQTLTVEITSRNQVVVTTLTRYMEGQGFKMIKIMEGEAYYDLVFVQTNI